MGVIVDSREPKKIKNILDVHGIEYVTRQLETGDVIAYNDDDPDIRVTIERKRLDDLISSFYGKRLHEQFSRMSNESFAVLIITGNMKEATKGFPNKIIPELVEEVVSLAVVVYNFRTVIWLCDGMDNVNYAGFASMVKIIKKVVSGNLDSIPEKRVKLSKDLRVNSLARLLGINAGLATRLLKKHGTVRAVLELTDEKLLKVKGVGPAKVKSIRYILDESINKGNYAREDVKDECTTCGKKLSVTKTPGGNILTCTFCIESLRRDTRTFK